MKSYRMSFAASLNFKHEFPERTAKRPSGQWDIEFQIWTNRVAMLKSINMQSNRASHRRDWVPLIKEN